MPSRFNKNGKNLSGNKADDWLAQNATPVETETAKETAPAEKAPEPEPTATASEPKGTPAKGESQEEPKRRGLSIRRNRKEAKND